MNWKWPETQRNSMAPWYQIIRRAVFVVPLIITGVFFVLLVYFSYGKKDATKVWNDIR